MVQLEDCDRVLKHDARIMCQAFKKSMGSEWLRRSVLDLFDLLVPVVFRRFSDGIA
jgi:hypothetical protein